VSLRTVWALIEERRKHVISVLTDELGEDISCEMTLRSHPTQEGSKAYQQVQGWQQVA